MEIESLHEYRFGPYEIRFWQAEIDYDHYPGNLSAQALHEWSNEMNELTLRSLIDFLSRLSYCNAVQVRSPGEEGTFIIYPEWP